MRTTTSTQPRSPRRAVALVVAVAACSLLAAACGGSEQASARMTSEVRPEAPRSELDPPGGLGELDDPEGFGDLGELDPEQLFGDLDDQLQDFADGMDGFGECAELTAAVGELLVAPFFTDDPDAEIDRLVGELEAQLPADLHDELATVQQSLHEAASEGLLGASGTLNDPAFTSAIEALAEGVGAYCTGAISSQD